MNSLQNRIIITFTSLIAIAVFATSLLVQNDVEKATLNSELQHANNVLEQIFTSIENMHNSSILHKQAQYSERRKSLKYITSLALEIVNKEYKRSQAGEITQNQARNLAKEAIRVMRYANGAGYLWIQNDILPIPQMVMHPTFPELEGIPGNDSIYYDALECKTNLLVEFVNQIRRTKDTAFVNYMWAKPVQNGKSSTQPKLSHVRLFEPWGWIIGTGIYTDDIEVEFKRHRENIRKKLFKKIASYRIGQSGYFYIFDGEGNFLVHPELEGTNGLNLKSPTSGRVFLNKLMEAVKNSQQRFEYMWNKPGEPENRLYNKIALIKHFEPHNWYICVSPYVDELIIPASKLRRKIQLSSLFFLALAILFAWYIAKTISTPLSLLASASQQIEKEGLADTLIPVSGTVETQTLGLCLQNMVKSIRLDQQQLQTMSFLVESAASPIVMADLKGILTHVNPAFIKTWGYNNEKEVLGRSINKFWRVSDRMDEIILALKNKGVIIDEIKGIHADGMIFQVQVSASLVLNDKHQPIAIMCSSLDISKRKMMEDQLRINEQKFRALFESSPIGVAFNRMVYDKQGNPVDFFYCDANKNFQSFTGVDPCGKLVTEVFPGIEKNPDFDWIKLCSRATQHGETVRFQQKMPQNNCWYDVVVFPFTSDHFVVTFLEITDQKRTEEKLRELQNYLGSIINSMPSIIIGVDSIGIVTQWNSQAEKSTGILQKDATGQSLEKVFPRLSGEMVRLKESIKTHQKKFEHRRAHYIDGECIYEDLTIFPLITGGANGAVIRIDDVTERVRIDEVIVQSEKMHSVGGLAAGMAHEINNPLGGMIQTAEVLANRLNNFEMPANIQAAEKAGVTMSAIKEFMENRKIFSMLNRIRESGSHAAEIVENMLSFTGKDENALTELNIADLLDQCIKLSRVDYSIVNKYDFKQINIIKEFDEDLPPVLGESGKIQQVFMNILKNGAEAMHETENTNDKNLQFILRLKNEPKKQSIRIEIEDNGPGMVEKIRKRIFEPFFTTKPTDRGTGLGLSVSYFIITQTHHGTMSVESEQGKGTKIIISLPATKKLA